jgi:hypothetical protein
MPISEHNQQLLCALFTLGAELKVKSLQPAHDFTVNATEFDIHGEKLDFASFYQQIEQSIKAAVFNLLCDYRLAGDQAKAAIRQQIVLEIAKILKSQLLRGSPLHRRLSPGAVDDMLHLYFAFFSHADSVEVLFGRLMLKIYDLWARHDYADTEQYIRNCLPLIAQYPGLQAFYTPSICDPPTLLLQDVLESYGSPVLDRPKIKVEWISEAAGAQKWLRITGTRYYRFYLEGCFEEPQQVSVSYDVNPETGEFHCSGFVWPELAELHQKNPHLMVYPPEALERRCLAAALYRYLKVKSECVGRWSTEERASLEEDERDLFADPVLQALLPAAQVKLICMQQVVLQRAVSDERGRRAAIDYDREREIEPLLQLEIDERQLKGYQNQQQALERKIANLRQVLSTNLRRSRVAARWGWGSGVAVGVLLGIAGILAFGLLSGGFGFAALPLLVGIIGGAGLVGWGVAAVIRWAVGAVGGWMHKRALSAELVKQEEQLTVISGLVSRLGRRQAELVPQVAHICSVPCRLLALTAGTDTQPTSNTPSACAVVAEDQQPASAFPR